MALLQPTIRGDGKWTEASYHNMASLSPFQRFMFGIITSEEEKIENIKEFLGTIKNQWEARYNYLSAISDKIIHDFLSRKVAEKKRAVHLFENMMIAQSDTVIKSQTSLRSVLVK